MASGSRGLAGEAVSWVIGLGIMAAGVLYYEDIKSVIIEQAGITPAMLAAAREASSDTQASKKDQTRGGSISELRIGRDGHYHADAEINGRSIEVMVDTGASMVALTYEDAERAGIYVKDSDFTMRVSTANGTGRVAPITISRISIGEITVRNVKGAVVESGKLSKTLLGMSFLGRLTRAEMRSGTLILEE
jgi:aspartyl protease family protein